MLGNYTLGEFDFPAFTGSVLLRSFNVLPSNSADVNGPNFLAAINEAKSYGFSLLAEEGCYDLDAGTIEMGYHRFGLIALGPRVEFRQRTSGAGRFFSFNGAITDPVGDGINRVVLGGAFQIGVIGNPDGTTTDAVYVNKSEDSKFSIRPRDADTLCRIEGVGSPPPFAGVGCVLNEFDITASPNWDGETKSKPYTVEPRNGLVATNCYASRLRLNLEQCGKRSDGGFAVVFDASGRNWLVGGSPEGNSRGGLSLSSSCRGFTVDNMDLEFNGLATDLICAGSHNVFRSCSMYTPNKPSIVSGSYNSFENCDMHGAVVSGTKNAFTRCDYLFDNGGFVDSGSGTIVRSCPGLADKG